MSSLCDLEKFLDDLQAISSSSDAPSLQQQRENVNQLLIQTYGSSSDLIAHDISPDLPNDQFASVPVETVLGPIDSTFDATQVLESFIDLFSEDDLLFPLHERIGQIPVKINSVPSMNLSKPTMDLDLVFDYNTGKIVGIKEVEQHLFAADGSTSLQREVGAPKDFVRGSSSNAPFLPGGVQKQSKTSSSINSRRLKKLQKDLSGVVNVEKSALFDLTLMPSSIPSLNASLQFDESGNLVVESVDQKTKAKPTAAKMDEDEEYPEYSSLQIQPKQDQTHTSGIVRDEHYYRQLYRERKEQVQLREERLNSLRRVVKEGEETVFEGIETEQEQLVHIHRKSAPSASSDSDMDFIAGIMDESNKGTQGWLKSAQKKAREETKSKKGPTWAVTERMANIAIDFDQLVPDPAIIYPFEIDDFQKEAAYHLEQGESVFIAAHTSAGKTVVAEYAIALAMKHMTRAIYTSPIKALSNQKYRDFKDTFGDDVGLITGDVSVRPDATCLIVTTEILRSMLYKGADIVRDIEWVIFDEVHYINDLERGVVWEEVIIMLPEHVGLIFLSATVPNTMEFADWVGRTKKKKVFVIKTEKRPVPLEHYLYYDKNMYKICDAKEYIPGGHSAVVAAIREKQLKKESASSKKQPPQLGRPGGPPPTHHKPSHVKTHVSFGSQKGEWIKIVEMLKKKNLLPAVAFVFSKKRCMDLAQGLINVDLTSKAEKFEIRKFIAASIKRLKGSDRALPQVLVMSELLSRGIGVHHSGLLPIIKEIVEILFSTGLIKILFATETFAMGVNMPTRTVLFNSTRKNDGSNFRDLLPGEYIQMSGRAGRRGLDNVGTVIIVIYDEAPESNSLRTMVTGKATKLISQFRLTYNMILNLLKMGGEFKVEDMMKRSFYEAANQRDTTLMQERLKIGKAKIKDIEEVVCRKGIGAKEDQSNENVEIEGRPLPEHNKKSANSPMVAYHELVSQERELMRKTQSWLVKSTFLNEMLCIGRVIVLNYPGFPKNSLAVVIRTPGTVPISKASLIENPDAKSTSIRVLILTGNPSKLVEHKYKVLVVDSSSNQIELITQRKLKKVEPERIDIQPDENHLNSVVKELDDIRIESLPGLPPPFDPIKNLKIKDLDFVDMNTQLKSVRELIYQSPCHKCEFKAEDFAQQDSNQKLREQVDALQFLLSDENLLMVPEYDMRVNVLKRLNFINEDGIVQLKGRVARELNNCEELIATEIIFENLLTNMPPEEIVALLSCLVFQDKSDSEPSLPPALKAAHKVLADLATKLGELQVDYGIPLNPHDYVKDNINPGLMEVVYEWAHNKPFHDIVRLSDVPEGSIVRTIVRLDETLRDFRSAAKLIGDTDLARKMEEASHLIKRDIVFASSLYIADAPQNRSSSSDGSALAP